MPCPKEDTLVAYSEGRLSQRDRSAVEYHLDQCHSCRRLVSLLVREEPTTEKQNNEPVGLNETQNPSHSFVFLGRGSLVGRYVILDQLDMGGMGVVYSAFDPALNRKVAVKCLLGRDRINLKSAQERLRREAQTMAKLSHPNVLSVFDVGEQDGQLFLAMDFIEGTNLKRWLIEKSPSWREVVEVFYQAGLGLSAAHQAGLVHRDFKPENVLIANDGRILVSDFGLARPATETQKSTEVNEFSFLQTFQWPFDEASSNLPTLTKSHELLGTPAYMAPEVAQGYAANAGSDQFSYCLAFHEGLGGGRPSFSQLQGVQDTASEKKTTSLQAVPRALRKIVQRGLSLDPNKRYPSMQLLLRELDRLRKKGIQRIFWAGAATGLVALLLGLVFWSQSLTSNPCIGAQAELAGVYNPQVKKKISDSFAATHLQYAGDTFERVEKLIGEFTQEWAALWEKTCRATKVQGVQSEQLLDLRMACLENRKKQFVALLDLWRQADASVVENAYRSAYSLRDFSECEQVQNLLQLPNPPSDPRRKSRLDDLQSLLVKGRAFHFAGKYQDANTLLKTTSLQAKELGYGPLRAEVQYWMGWNQEALGQYTEAKANLVQAELLSLQFRDVRTLVMSLIGLTYIAGTKLIKTEEGLQYAQLAEAAMIGFENDPIQKAKFLFSRGTVYGTDRKYDLSLADLQQARLLYEQNQKTSDPDYLRILVSVGLIHDRNGNSAEAVSIYRQALEVGSKFLGSTHPMMIRILSYLGISEGSLGNYEEAQTLLQQVENYFQDSSQPENLLKGTLLYHPRGQVYFIQKKFDLALRDLQKDFEISQKEQGVEHPHTLLALNNLANIYGEMGQLKKCIQISREAVSGLEKVLGENHPTVSPSLDTLGFCLYQNHNYQESLKYLEKGSRLSHKLTDNPCEIIPYQLHLAQALWDSGQDRTRAIQLANTSKDSCPSPNSVEQKKWLDQLIQWLNMHKPLPTP